MLLMSDSSKYSALAIMLLTISLAYYKGRHVNSANARSLAWTQIPLIAFLAVSVGPSIVATLIYLGYKSGLLQAGPSGYQFSTSILRIPLDFAVMNWGFVVLYLTSRLLRSFRRTHSAMWFSAVAMSLLNLPLFLLAPDMISSVYDAGQGIGMIQAMLSMPLWFGPSPAFLDPDSGIGLLIFAPLAPIPLSGFVGWIVGRFIGWAISAPEEESMRP